MFLSYNLCCQHHMLNDKKGFTLIELLVVISIIGVLSTVAMTSLNGARKKARDARRKIEIGEIQKALELYYADHGEYPASGGGTIPNGGWSDSGNFTWTTLGTALASYAPVFPIDPINTVATSEADWVGCSSIGLSYSYFSAGYDCPRQWYMLIYKLEAESQPRSPGAYACQLDGSGNYTYFNYDDYAGNVTVGVCKGCDL